MHQIILITFHLWIQAFTERSFFEFVDNKTICYSYASHICFLNLETKLQSVFQSSVREIGALTANGSKRIFAFSEQKLSPSIFVYSFPEFQLKNKLKGTAPLDCTSLALSDGGPFLGCCSSLPNYTITVWVIELPTIEDTVDKGLMATYLNESDKETQLPPIPLLDPEVCTKAKLTPAAVCWTATSELYVTCAQGFLLLVDPESLDVSVQFNPSCKISTDTVGLFCKVGLPVKMLLTSVFVEAAAEAIPELRQDTFQGLTLWRDDCIAVGMESAVHCLRVKGGQIEIIKTWRIEQTVTTVMHSPDNEMLVVTSNKGQIFTVNPNRSDEILKILDVGSGRSVAAAFSHTPTNICVVTCVACCHVAQYAAVGTASGVVLFVDLKREQQPQLIHEFHLDHSVDQIVQDADAASSERMVQLKPEEEVQGHPLGPACLTLSPHHLWLASVGRGGLLRVRETTSMDQFIQLQCHPYGSSRVGSVLFSADSQTLLTVGLNDGAIVCANLRMKDRDLGKMKKSVDSLHTGSEKLKASAGATTVDVTREEGTLPSPPPSHSTWLESRQKTAVKEENEQQEAIAATLRKDLAQLYASVSFIAYLFAYFCD
uniref:Cilia- and flagella-associated protein 43 n=1 Tax=Takifugu rubripes TaxID=31033 RepID=Q90XY7_TAKRU|nr:hypothetical protein [Takifugu rubripes]